MARGGGGARKVRPEGQNMRCVVQLLTAGAKSACPRPVASPEGHPRDARVPARHFAANEETRVLPSSEARRPPLTPRDPIPRPLTLQARAAT